MSIHPRIALASALVLGAFGTQAQNSGVPIKAGNDVIGAVGVAGGITTSWSGPR